MNKTRKIVAFSIVILFSLTGISSVYAENKTIDTISGISGTLANNTIDKYEELSDDSIKDYYRYNIEDRYKGYLDDSNIPRVSALIDGEEWDIIVPDDFPSIQIALDHSQKGFKIFIRGGIYYEHITIKLDGIVLQGESPETTIIDGINQKNVIWICGNNVSLSGFTVQQSGMNELGIYYAGVKLSGFNNCIIRNCKIQNNKGYGIIIENALNCTLFQNFISMNQYDGVYLVNAHQVLIAETFLENNNDNEISCYNSSSISIVNNSILSTKINAVLFSLSNNSILVGNNITGAGFTCIKLQCSSFNVIKQNNIYSESDSALSFLYKSNSNMISHNTIIGLSYLGDSIGILNQDSDGNEIFENVISAFSIGVDILVSIQLELQFNEIFLNNIGISLNMCNDICIIENNLSYNKGNALYAEQSNSILIQNNTIAYNGLNGIHMVLYSDHSQIIDNHIVHNSVKGINLNCCQYNTISDNFISYNELSGLYIYECSISYISNNIFVSNNEYGLHISHFYFGEGNNNVVDNRFYECGVFNERSFSNIFQNNTINDRYLLYLEGEKNRVISNESIGSIILVKCDNITIQHQHINNTSIGIQLIFSSNCNITENIFEYNKFGVYLMYTNLSSITKNNFIKNEIDATYVLWITNPIWTNTWDLNYWDSRYSIVFPIHGYKYRKILTVLLIKFHDINFDFHPSNIPYKYET